MFKTVSAAPPPMSTPLASSAYSKAMPSSAAAHTLTSPASSMSYATTALALSSEDTKPGGYGAYPSRPNRTARSSASSSHFRLKSPSRRTHTRSSSNASTISTPPSTLPFPNYDFGSGTESFIAPLPPALLDTSSLKSPSGSSSKIRIRGMHRKNSSTSSATAVPDLQASTLDLSKSTAENENRGAYTASDTYLRRPSAPVISYADRSGHSHQRTSSSVSYTSVNTDSSSRLLGAQYVHPMRQTPQPYTPPIARSLQASRAGSEYGGDDESVLSPAALATSTYRPPSGASVPYAPLPPTVRRRPSLHVRTASHSRSPSQTTIHQISATPGSARYLEVFSPESAPQTARTSFDSMFASAARKKSQNSLRQAATQQDPYEYDQVARELSRELFAKQKAKDERLAVKEARIREREAARAQRREQAHERKHSKSAATEKVVPYESTVAASPIYDEKESGLHSPATTTATKEYYPSRETKAQAKPNLKRAKKAAGNQFSTTGFRLKTLWIRIMRALGLRSAR